MTLHTYDTVVTWTGNRGTGTSGYRDYARDHDVAADNRTTIAGSSDPAFRGDRSRWNPEQLLVASLSQCHMLEYLHLYADAGVVVTGYVDHAMGAMTETGDGGRFTQVTLRPEVMVASANMVEEARAPARRGAPCVLHRQLRQLPGPARATHPGARAPCLIGCVGTRAITPTT